MPLREANIPDYIAEGSQSQGGEYEASYEIIETIRSQENININTLRLKVNSLNHVSEGIRSQ